MLGSTDTFGLERQRFDARAERYARALRLLPESRYLDVIPYAGSLLDVFGTIRGLRIADVMGGNGFLSRFLGRAGAEMSVVDNSPNMMRFREDLDPFPRFVLTRGDHSEIEIGKDYDAVVCHGGLHHVYILNENGEPDPTASNTLQHALLDRWFQMLRPGGLLLLGDVDPFLRQRRPIASSPEWFLNLSALPDVLLPTDPAVLEACHFLLGKPFRALNRIRADEYAERLSSASMRRPAGGPIPRRFFDVFVKTHCATGHQAWFFDPELGVEHLRGRAAPQICTIPIPWVFPDRSSAAWFYYEKFAVDRPAHTPKEMSDDLKELMLANLGDLLGFHSLPSGTTIVNFELAFLCVHRPQ